MTQRLRPQHDLSVRGLKRTWGLDRRRLLGLLRGALGDERAPEGSLEVAFPGERTMRRINRDFRAHDETTDVLSFSYVNEPHAGGVLGEVYVSVTVAEAQAQEAGCSLAEELARLTLHGTLHVLGWTHDTAVDRKRMLARQERLLAKHYRRRRDT